MRRLMRPFLVIVLLVAALAPRGAGAAPTTGSIAGTVSSALGDAVPGARVRLLGTTHTTVTAVDGSYRFDDLPPGTYQLDVESDRYGMTSSSVSVAGGETVSLDPKLDLVIHGDEVVVTATPDARALSTLAQSVGVLAGDELAVAARSSLGETLAPEPGVNSTSFGAGASRPIVRGQGGNRIRILENGVDSGDVSDTSPDHAVALEPLDADKIEVVRGPATLLYGSNAIGGVVNLIDDRIPEFLPGTPIEGEISFVGSSNADEKTGAASVGGSFGQVAWHASGFKTEAGDYASGEGSVVNSDVEANGGSLGFSIVGDSGFFGVAGRRYDTNYGNPAEEEVRLDMRQRRVDARGGLTRKVGIFDGLRFRFGSTDYEHAEIEGGELGTRFLNEAWEGRIDATHRQLGPFRGSIGVQLSNRQFEAIGEEAFVPPTDNDLRALFLFEEVGRGKLHWQFGVRHEQQSSGAEGQPDRDFSATSGSIGAVWNASDGLTAALTVSRSVKLPDPEELYAEGPHIATGVFEIGDADLSAETASGIDLSLRGTSGRFRGELSLFMNRVDDFIYGAFTGETVPGEEEDLPVIEFVQDDAEFAGGEAQAHIELVHAEPHHLELELTSDMVRAELRDSGEALPQIPPLRLAAGLRYQGEHLSGTFFARHTEEQDRVAEFETPTDRFTVLDASVGYRFFAGDVVHALILSGTNLTDELTRNHVSFLKDLVASPGRDVRLTYRILF
jgi:iron complex outermembrane recepter protein